MKKTFISIIMTVLGALNVLGAQYAGIYISASGIFSSVNKNVTITITGAYVLDESSRTIEEPVTLDKMEIYRSEAHGQLQKVATLDTPVVTSSGKFDAPVVWVDDNLPTTETSTQVEYVVYAYIGDYKSQGSPVNNAGSIIGGSGFGIDYRNYPMGVSNLRVDIDDSMTKAVVKFTAPSHDTNGHELQSITNIKIEKYDFSRYTFVAKKTIRSATAKPGAELEWEDTEVAMGDELWYRVTVVANELPSQSADVHSYLGEDQPLGISNLHISATESGHVLTWTAPKVGVRGGNIIPSNLRYTILRQVEGQQLETLTTDHEGTSFTDSDLKEHVATYNYFITVRNSQGVGAQASTSIYSGKGYSLPFTESVSNTSAGYYYYDNTGWLTSALKQSVNFGWTTSANITDMDNEKYIECETGVATVVLYPTNTVVGHEYYLDSPELLMGEHTNAHVSFKYYSMSGYNTVVTVGLSTDGGATYTEFGRINYADLTETGWKNVTFDTPAVDNNSSVRIRFACIKNTHCNSIAIDDINIEGYTDTNGISNMEYKPTEGMHFNLSGQRINASAKGLHIMNGKKYIK